jgi:hypothetical protein
MHTTPFLPIPGAFTFWTTPFLFNADCKRVAGVDDPGTPLLAFRPAKEAMAAVDDPLLAFLLPDRLGVDWANAAPKPSREDCAIADAIVSRLQKPRVLLKTTTKSDNATKTLGNTTHNHIEITSNSSDI